MLSTNNVFKRAVPDAYFLDTIFCFNRNRRSRTRLYRARDDEATSTSGKLQWTRRSWFSNHATAADMMMICGQNSCRMFPVHLSRLPRFFSVSVVDHDKHHRLSARFMELSWSESMSSHACTCTCSAVTSVKRSIKSRVSVCTAAQVYVNKRRRRSRKHKKV